MCSSVAENDMRREAERKEQERKKRQGDSVSGGRQPNAGVPRSNLSAQNSGKNSWLHPEKRGEV